MNCFSSSGLVALALDLVLSVLVVIEIIFNFKIIIFHFKILNVTVALKLIFQLYIIKKVSSLPQKLRTYIVNINRTWQYAGDKLKFTHNYERIKIQKTKDKITFSI